MLESAILRDAYVFDVHRRKVQRLMAFKIGGAEIDMRAGIFGDGELTAAYGRIAAEENGLSRLLVETDADIVPAAVQLKRVDPELSRHFFADHAVESTEALVIYKVYILMVGGDHPHDVTKIGFHVRFKFQVEAQVRLTAQANRPPGGQVQGRSFLPYRFMAGKPEPVRLTKYNMTVNKGPADN